MSSPISAIASRTPFFRARATTAPARSNVGGRTVLASAAAAAARPSRRRATSCCSTPTSGDHLDLLHARPKARSRRVARVYNFAPLNYYQRPDERYIAGAFANYEITPAIKPYMEFMFMDDQHAGADRAVGRLRQHADDQLRQPVHDAQLFSAARSAQPDNLITGFLGTFPIADSAPVTIRTAAAPRDRFHRYAAATPISRASSRSSGGTSKAAPRQRRPQAHQLSRRAWHARRPDQRFLVRRLLSIRPHQLHAGLQERVLGGPAG